MTCNIFWFFRQCFTVTNVSVVWQLNRGQLLIVPPYLVKRQKQHFHHLEEFGIDLILGCNGFIWVGEHVEAKDDMIEDQVSQSDSQVLFPNKNCVSLEEQEKNYTILETRKYISRAANAVRVLSTLRFIKITLAIIKGIMIIFSRIFFNYIFFINKT